MLPHSDYLTTTQHGNTMKVVINTCYGGFSLSDEAIRAWESRTGRQFDAWDVPRHDPDLVAVVLLFGDEAADSCSELEVVTIEGNQYLITEYDGAETIRTPTTTAWITVDSETVEQNAEAERQPLQLKMWPHKQRAMATRMQALGSKLRDEWHMPHSEDSLAETLNKGENLDGAQIQWSAAKHISSTDLVDKLIDRLEAQLTTLRDLNWWARRDFYGYTDFITDTAGLALAFSAAVPLATYIDDPNEILMNRFDNID